MVASPTTRAIRLDRKRKPRHRRMLKLPIAVGRLEQRTHASSEDTLETFTAVAKDRNRFIEIDQSLRDRKLDSCAPTGVDSDGLTVDPTTEVGQLSLDDPGNESIAIDLWCRQNGKLFIAPNLTLELDLSQPTRPALVGIAEPLRYPPGRPGTGTRQPSCEAGVVSREGVRFGSGQRNARETYGKARANSQGLDKAVVRRD